jgi:hypothetical protein
MPATLERKTTNLKHAISEIQSEWSPRERARRHRLADLRQQRLMRMLSPQPRLEAYDCQCDMGDVFEASGEAEGNRTHRYVLIEG